MIRGWIGNAGSADLERIEKRGRMLTCSLKAFVRHASSHIFRVGTLYRATLNGKDVAISWSEAKTMRLNRRQKRARGDRKVNNPS